MEKRIEKLESNHDVLQREFHLLKEVNIKILTNLESINKHIEDSLDLGEKVVRQDERQKVNEKRFTRNERKIEDLERKVNWITVKIAGFTAIGSIIGSIIMFIISKIT